MTAEQLYTIVAYLCTQGDSSDCDNENNTEAIPAAINSLFSVEVDVTFGGSGEPDAESTAEAESTDEPSAEATAEAESTAEADAEATAEAEVTEEAEATQEATEEAGE